MARTAEEVIANTLPLSGRVITAHNRLARDIDAAMALINGTNLISAPTFSAGSDDTAVASTAFTFRVNGVAYAVDAIADGTAFSAQTVTANKWAAYRISVSAAKVITLTPASANVAGYADEASAIAAVPAVPTGEVNLGYLTVKTGTGKAWVAATDALKGGSSGNPASETNFYPATPEWTLAAQTSPYLFG